jgi:hypothetical protein
MYFFIYILFYFLQLNQTKVPKTSVAGRREMKGRSCAHQSAQQGIRIDKEILWRRILLPRQVAVWLSGGDLDGSAAVNRFR